MALSARKGIHAVAVNEQEENLLAKIVAMIAHEIVKEYRRLDNCPSSAEDESVTTISIESPREIPPGTVTRKKTGFTGENRSSSQGTRD